METFQFNSKDFPKSLQPKAIESVWSENFLMDIDLHAAPSFSMMACRLPSLSISSFSGNASGMVRSSLQALASGSELIICVSKDSHVTVQRCGKSERVFAPGEAHVWLADMSTRCTVDSSYHATMISIPTVDLENASLDIDQILDKGHAPLTSELTLLLSYAENLLYNLENIGKQAVCAATNHIRDMALLALRPHCDKKDSFSGKAGERTKRLKRLKADIRANLNHPNLSPALIAGREGISERYLRYLLADEQTHFSGLVSEMRLTQSYERLIDIRNRDCPISTIAFGCGFNDLSYFYRIFKRRFNATPSEIRSNYHAKVEY